MRHYRRHNSGSERVRKIMLRILFVLIAAAVITFGSIILGNYLQRKVDEAEKLTESGETNDSLMSDQAQAAPDSDFYDSPTVFGASVDISGFSSEDEAVLAVNELSASYDTVMIPVTSSDGKLVYDSPALCELTRMTPPEDDSELRIFTSAVAAAKTKGMRVCVNFECSYGISYPEDMAVIDGTLIAELASLGADEVLITLSDGTDSLSSTEAEALSTYISTCRDISDNSCPIGVLLSSKIYLDDDSAKQIQDIASSASFLAINFPSDDDTSLASAYRYASRCVTTLLGSFTVYNMRVIIDCRTELLAPMYQACTDSGITNICFASFVQPDELSYREQSAESTNETEETEPVHAPEANTNPYATTSENSTTETEAEPVETAETVSGEDMWY